MMDKAFLQIFRLPVFSVFSSPKLLSGLTLYISHNIKIPLKQKINLNKLHKINVKMSLIKLSNFSRESEHMPTNTAMVTVEFNVFM